MINWDAVWKVGVAAGVAWSGFQSTRDAKKARREREHVAATLKESTTATEKKLDGIHVLVDGEYTLALLDKVTILKELYGYTMKQSDWVRVEAAQQVYDRHIAQQKVIHDLEMRKIEAVSAGKKMREP
jgi:hypothetical protein